MTARKMKWKGMNWIRQEKRLAIYMRDGMACVYCHRGVEDGAVLTLDHVISAEEEGSTNRADNLVTCCRTCNSKRRDRPFKMSTTKEQRKFIRKLLKKKLKIKTAKRILAERRNGDAD